jgi:methyl-accepting chemotaxis protein
MTTEERFEKIEAGIRDLIVVNRTTLTAVDQVVGTVGQLAGAVGQLADTVGVMRDSIGELRDAQKQTDEKLNILIQVQIESEEKVSRLADTVDKLVRRKGPNGQSGEAN